jgi:hydrogenase expression/formation protein HypE
MPNDERPPIDPLAGMSCPIPISDYPQVLLAHGGGGKLTQQLIEKMFVAAFGKPLGPLHDGAVFPLGESRLAFTTDSYVVNPIFFPGGSIGELAVNGTINDLAMCGARPLYLSAAFIIEEGLAMDDLWRVVVAMQRAAAAAGVAIVTGDTKVVDRGKGDKIFITTSGVGVVPPGIEISPQKARPGDNVIINGPIAQHGIAIMSVREGLQFQAPVKSDTAPLNGLVDAMLAACSSVHVMRDPTRGGVASVLNEIAGAASVGITIDEEAILVDEAVRGACEILGFDPLYVANEGKLLAFVPADCTGAVLTAMRAHPLGKGSQVIGKVVTDHPHVVVMKTRIGGSRVVDMLSGEQLPRIC